MNNKLFECSLGFHEWDSWEPEYEYVRDDPSQRGYWEEIPFQWKRICKCCLKKEYLHEALKGVL